LFNNRYQQETVRYHARKLAMLSIGCSDASVGFFDAADEWISSPSSEGEHTSGERRRSRRKSSRQ
jgi:hypothetical protein